MGSSYCDAHPFHRCGQAALSDLETPEWRDLFAHLEQEQARFRQQEAAFRSPEYLWPRDSLHDWSRCWEYPYAFYHLRRFLAEKPTPPRPVVIDVGSGVTFFPFALATAGFDVVATDTDPICRTDVERAVPLVSALPGSVSFRLIEGGRLPAHDGEASAACCVSVLEHIPQFEYTVREIARVLRPGGLLVLTNDLDLRGDHDIGPTRYRQLRAELLRHFEWVFPEAAVHPKDILRTTNGPYPSQTPKGLGLGWFHFKQRVLKPLFGKPPRPALLYDLAVQAFVLRKRG